MFLLRVMMPWLTQAEGIAADLHLTKLMSC